MTGAVLFRADASAEIGAYGVFAHADGLGDYQALGGGFGPRLALNVGYAPSRLVRLGLGLGSDFSIGFAIDQGIPGVSADGWLRWWVGPTVGFRFGPRAPLELEVHVAFANVQLLGGQAGFFEDLGSPGFEALAPQYGVLQSVLLYYRPSGPRSLFALHGGLSGGWSYAGDASSNVVIFTSSLVVGVSLGL